MNKFFLGLFSILLVSCHDSYRRLGDNYVYMNRIIAKAEPQKSYETLHFLITEQVLNYNYDNDYIVAYQIPDFDEYWESLVESSPETQKDSLRNLATLMNNIHDCYWIIRKKDCKIWGPMTKNDFNAKCHEIGVLVELDSKYANDFLPSREP